MFTNGKKHIKKFSLLLALIFMFTGTVAYAESFKDVPSTHWAKDYIQKMNNAKIVTGDGTGNFLPSGSVTKSQAVAMVARMMSMDNTKKAQARQTHQTFLNEVGVQTWYQDDLAIALSMGVLSKDDIRGFYLSGKDRNIAASRVEITRYLTRAMGLEEEAKKTSFIALPFTDVEKIGSEDRKYVDMMIKKTIVNPKGDAQGKFNPVSNVTRAEMAKMTSIAYDYMVANLLLNRTLVNEQTPVKTQTITGTITSVMKMTDEAYITIEDKRGNKVTFRANSSTDAKMDNKKMGLTELVAGLKIEAEVTEDFRVISLITEGINEEYTGTVTSVIQTSPQMLTIEYKPDEKSKTTERKTFQLDSDVDITLDEEDAYFREIKIGDNVEIKVRNSKITSIDAESQFKEIEGIIKEIKYSPETKLVVVDEDENEYEYPVDNKASIYRSKKKADIASLRKGDEVVIEIEYNVITDITATVVKGTDEGTIEAISISNKPEITIRNTKGESTTYILPLNTSVYIDRTSSNIYGLKLGYYVEVDIEGNEIVSIDAVARDRSDKATGLVEYVSTKAGVIEISEIDFTSGDKKKTVVYVTEDTIFLDPKGNKSRFSYIGKGDEILVMGTFDGTLFIAETIMVLYEGN